MQVKAKASGKCLQVAKPVRVHRCTSRGKDLWIVSYYDADGVRQRISRASEQVANEEAARIRERLSRGQPVAPLLTEIDRLVLERAKEILRPHGLELDHAMATLSQALKHVDVHSLVEAVRWFSMNQPGSPTPKLVEEVLTEMLKAKEKRSDYHVSDLRRKLTPFAQSFRCPIALVGTAEIEGYIHGLKKVTSRTKWNVLRAIGTLFNFARRKRYIPFLHPGIKEVEPLVHEPRTIGIFTPAEMTSLLMHAPSELIPVLVIGGFCGLRTEEIKRLDWQQVKLSRGVIEVLAPNAKTRVARVVKIPENVLTWLKHLEKTNGFVSVYRNPVNELLKLAAKSGVKWKRNGLRHSFISYQAAVTENVHSVAFRAGNSAKSIYSNYLVGVDPADAEAWFGITPFLVQRRKEELAAEQRQ